MVGRHLALGLSVLVIAGCSTSDNATTTTVPNTTTTSTSTSTTTSTTSTSTASTTTSTTSTTTIPPTTTAASLPDDMPSEDEVIKITNTWLHRLWEISSNPAAFEATYICLADTSCTDRYIPQLDDTKARGAHVEGAEPGTVKYIRFAEPTGTGGFMVSFWTNPTQAGTEVNAAGARDERTSSPNGLGLTLVFAPFPDDDAYPWRATELIPDPK